MANKAMAAIICGFPARRNTAQLCHLFCSASRSTQSRDVVTGPFSSHRLKAVDADRTAFHIAFPTKPIPRYMILPASVNIVVAGTIA
jgi:hypothetical protein